ncbi:LOW QUALITY PROTEIN: hypothetical protein KIPB_001559, partial [Kipferlia bialata]
GSFDISRCPLVKGAIEVQLMNGVDYQPTHIIQVEAEDEAEKEAEAPAATGAMYEISPVKALSGSSHESEGERDIPVYPGASSTPSVSRDRKRETERERERESNSEALLGLLAQLDETQPDTVEEAEVVEILYTSELSKCGLDPEAVTPKDGFRQWLLEDFRSPEPSPSLLSLCIYIYMCVCVYVLVSLTPRTRAQSITGEPMAGEGTLLGRVGSLLKARHTSACSEIVRRRMRALAMSQAASKAPERETPSRDRQAMEHAAAWERGRRAPDTVKRERTVSLPRRAPKTSSASASSASDYMARINALQDQFRAGKQGVTNGK